MSDKFLQGRTAVVTGGASGMGLAIAQGLAKAGANLALGSLLASKKDHLVTGELAYLPQEDDFTALASRLATENGVKVMTANLDVTRPDSIASFKSRIADQFERVDILVNAAGITAEQEVCNHDEGLWNKVVDVNLNGPFRLMKEFLPGMIERKYGRIINIASTAASVGASTSAAYCASKAGLVALSKCVALEGAEHGVTCNTISPTWVDTNFGRDWMSHIAETAESRKGDEYIKDVCTANPQKRLVKPQEVAELALYLCRDDALAMTMQDLTLSAGSLW